MQSDCECEIVSPWLEFAPTNRVAEAIVWQEQTPATAYLARIRLILSSPWLEFAPTNRAAGAIVWQEQTPATA